MTESASINDNQPGWGRLAFSVVLAATVIRILVVFSTQVPLFFDEAQYWTWAQDLALGYYSKPPMIAWAIAATTSVCGDGPGCVRIGASIMHGATALVLFYLGRHFYNARTGFWTTLTYAVLPGVSLSSIVISTDAFLLFFWAAALLALVRAEETDAPRWWIALGAAIGLGLLTKYAMAFFLMCLAVDALWKTSAKPILRRRGLWGALALSLIIYLPNAWWNWVNDFPSYRHTGDNINLNGDLFHPISAFEFLGGQFGVFGPILFGVFLILCWVRLGRRSGQPELSDHCRRLFAFSIPVLLVISVEAVLSRSHGNWAATSYIAATVLVAGELVRVDKAIWLKASLAIHVSAAILLYNFDLIARTFDLPITPDLDPGRHMRGWDRAGDWAADIQRDFPNIRFLFDDRKVMSEIMYYTRPHPLDAVMWNPKGQRKNHYEMTTDLSEAIGGDLLYFIRHDWADRAATSFADSKLIAIFRSRAYTGDVLELRAYLLKDFQGYER